MVRLFVRETFFAILISVIAITSKFLFAQLKADLQSAKDKISAYAQYQLLHKTTCFYFIRTTEKKFN